jgi:hypothetical protein
MAQWLESRIQATEARVEKLYRSLLDLIAQLRNVQQQLQQAFQQQVGGGGGGGNPSFLFCTTGADLAAGSHITGQTVNTLSGGSDDTINSDATLYNITGNDIPSGSLVFLGSCPDGTFGVIGVACTA